MCNDDKRSEKYPGFIDRLIELRDSKNFETKTQFAEWLGVPRNSYSMIESGYRPPNKKFINQLLIKTGKSEEYWLYGVTDEKEFSQIREEFKMCKKAIDDIMELGLVDEQGMATSIVNEKFIDALAISAFKADMLHIILKRKQGN